MVIGNMYVPLTGDVLVIFPIISHNPSWLSPFVNEGCALCHSSSLGCLAPLMCYSYDNTSRNCYGVLYTSDFHSGYFHSTRLLSVHFNNTASVYAQQRWKDMVSLPYLDSWNLKLDALLSRGVFCWQNASRHFPVNVPSSGQVCPETVEKIGNKQANKCYWITSIYLKYLVWNNVKCNLSDYMRSYCILCMHVWMVCIDRQGPFQYSFVMCLPLSCVCVRCVCRWFVWSVHQCCNSRWRWVVA